MIEEEFRSIYPPEVIELMLQRQEEQGNRRDIRPFLENNRRDKKRGGFNWENTIEDWDFWHEVLVEKNFKLFYKLYPKKDATLELCQKIEELIFHLEN